MTGVRIRDAWDRKGLTGKLQWLLLVPLSSVYLLLVHIRNALYSLGWIRIHALPRPVISVGNLTVGGTGKTPTCLWLAHELLAHGVKVAILSRGYKGKAAAPVILLPDNNGSFDSETERELSAAGDEPFMMSRLYGQTVAVGRER